LSLPNDNVKIRVYFQLASEIRPPAKPPLELRPVTKIINEFFNLIHEVLMLPVETILLQMSRVKKPQSYFIVILLTTLMKFLWIMTEWSIKAKKSVSFEHAATER